MDMLNYYIVTITAILLMVYFLVFLLLKKLGKNPHNILPQNIASRTKIPLIILLLAIGIQAGLINREIVTREPYVEILQQLRSLMLIFSFAWLIVVVIRIAKKRFLNRFDLTSKDNLRARKIFTQFNIIERVVVFIVILFAVGIALLTFEGIQEVGVSILTSAGIAGIILGLSAQKVIGTIFAGIQIAISQPIRIDDVVIVEGEWGRIEEIRLTYVVVQIWDKRRLVLPTTYFIDTPFENWTRNSSEILGTVYLYTDYSVPLEALRLELTRLLEQTDLWDKQVNVIQVTNLSEKTMELRALVSAVDASTAWELRVYIREKLMAFLREKYPNSLPRSRVELRENPSSREAPSNPLQK